MNNFDANTGWDWLEKIQQQKELNALVSNTAWKLWDNETLKQGIRSITNKYIDKNLTAKEDQRRIWEDMMSIAVEVLNE